MRLMSVSYPLFAITRVVAAEKPVDARMCAPSCAWHVHVHVLVRHTLPDKAT